MIAQENDDTRPEKTLVGCELNEKGNGGKYGEGES